MTTSHLAQKARLTLALMPKAALDAFLLGTTILIILFYTEVLFIYWWLIIPAYALVFLLALVIRLRMASRNASGTPGRDETLEEADKTLVSENNRVGLMLFWRQGH